ncbi:type IV toxin-antitoxin system AbiEi family antitoxin [Microbacterium sp. MYb62]|uniref:type IV toxin-antitoxin system AbiEi family antitoxin n=1 Tax=Microbacterium sp. MYb62 TaxID=1848690 RepID=UPI000CFB0119|nr:type IV toxin-antitoxin system AbiEi family antitoxin [Microbacterium sp. MYb62]PRB13430.1 SAM-dependent methyltransferase [Microbacterium sp. MYb62]
MHPAFLYVPGERLSLSELSAARIDGHVVEVGDAYVPADLFEGPDVRASAIASLVQPGTAASGPTAAWIHGAGDSPPGVHHLKRCVERRIRAVTSARLVFHDTVVPPSDVLLIGGIPVSTPVRTMLDLATAVHRDPRVLTWMDRLAEVFPDAPEAAGETLRGMSRVPGSRAGTAVLERLALRKR